ATVRSPARLSPRRSRRCAWHRRHHAPTPAGSGGPVRKASEFDLRLRSRLLRHEGFRRLAAPGVARTAFDLAESTHSRAAVLRALGLHRGRVDGAALVDAGGHRTAAVADVLDRAVGIGLAAVV